MSLKRVRDSKEGGLETRSENLRGLDCVGPKAVVGLWLLPTAGSHWRALCRQEPSFDLFLKNHRCSREETAGEAKGSNKTVCRNMEKPRWWLGQGDGRRCGEK